MIITVIFDLSQFGFVVIGCCCVLREFYYVNLRPIYTQIDYLLNFSSCVLYYIYYISHLYSSLVLDNNKTSLEPNNNFINNNKKFLQVFIYLKKKRRIIIVTIKSRLSNLLQLKTNTYIDR